MSVRNWFLAGLICTVVLVLFTGAEVVAGLGLRELPLLLLVLFLVFGGALFSQAAQEQKQPPWKLADAKVEAARQACLAFAQEYADGRATHELVQQWSRRWMDARRSTTTKKSEQVAAIEDHVRRMHDLEAKVKERVAAKRAQPSEAYVVEYYRIEAELQLSQAKAGK
jgi:hypothetical protein